jgi:peptidyl-tRNA hydrolase, PTH1 family
MKYLIVGLGNPGADYHETRHNVGFMVLDHMASRMNGTFASDRFGHTCELKHKGKTLVLLKPNTYMNLSGKAVRYHQQAHKLPLEQILVITDDLALPFGKLRLRGKGSHGGHNGLRDIQAILGTEAYARMRIGVGSEFQKGQQVDYVLSRFSAEERPVLATLLDKAADGVLSFALQGLDRTMNVVNT